MQHVHTRFLDWNLPLLEAITKQLLANMSGEYVDLSNTLVIVPTVQSGRRLREALALACRGLFPPVIVTPDGFLDRMIREQKTHKLASESNVTAAWVSVLKELDFNTCEALFATAPEPTLAWQHVMAQRLIQLRNELGEEGIDFKQVARSTFDGGYDSARWQILARLEGLYIRQLKQLDLQDPNNIRHKVAQSLQQPKEITHIILAATPDPQPLVVQALESAQHHVSLEVWIYGDKDAHFDQWGRPDAACWSQRHLDLEAWGVHLQTFHAPKPAAAFIAESTKGKAPESLLIGLADSRLNAIVADALITTGIPYYDPGGQALTNSSLGRLAEILCQFYHDRSTGMVRTLLQHPDTYACLETKTHARLLLRQLDQLFENHLTPHLSALIHFARRKPATHDLHAALVRLHHMVDDLATADRFAPAFARLLQVIYAHKQLSTSKQSDVSWREHAASIHKQISQIAETETLFPQLPKDFGATTLLHALRTHRVYPTRPSEAHDLLGWLELLWNDAPHLILAGFNEHSVPESITGDAFLPESLREKLGLRTNAQRFARDAYLLEALCRRRVKTQGRTDLLVLQNSSEQHPLKPSRLLFQCNSGILLQRTRQLFITSSAPRPHSAHGKAWMLQPPPELTLPRSLSVSALNNYLQCPFRFFLRHILGMKPVDVETPELNTPAFGKLFHDTIAKLEGAYLDRTTKQADLIKKLHGIAKRMIESRYGNDLSFALCIQREILMSYIHSFAEHQIADIAHKGATHILNTEKAFELFFDDYVIKGRIDRIDQRGRALELVDYKTGNHSVNPEKAHLTPLGKSTPLAHLPEEALFEQQGKIHYWTDLQLPLYKLAGRHITDSDPSLAYFNLGESLEKSGIQRWDTFTAAHLESAKACAEALVAQIKRGVFWPPNPNIHETYDHFHHLFPDGIENSVDADAFSNYSFLQEE